MGSPHWSTYVNRRRPTRSPATTSPTSTTSTRTRADATAANLDAKFGNAAQQIPVILTEFGWNPPGEFSDPVVTPGTTSGWGIPLRQYLDARPQISWMGWLFDNFWTPLMFDQDWNLLSGEHQGEMIKALARRAAATPPRARTTRRSGATAVASSSGSATSGAAKAVDGDCTNARALAVRRR